MRCIGFLDGTIRQQCRPVRGQRAIFSGHKRYHGLKFQALTVPDGLIAAMFGPVEGRLHDSTMLGLSNLMIMICTFLSGWPIYTAVVILIHFRRDFRAQSSDFFILLRSFVWYFANSSCALNRFEFGEWQFHYLANRYLVRVSIP